MANVFRADHIGTFIKPQALQTAQENSAASADAAAARHAAEEAAILEALQMQSAVLLTFRTDGQLRRANFDEPYITAISGLRRSQAPVRSASLRSPWEVYSTLKQTSRVTESEVSFLKTKARSPFKVCLSSPSALALRFYRPGVTDAVYRTVADLAAAFGEILQSEVNALFQDGVEYVQLSSLAYHALFEGGGASVFDLPVNDAAALFDALVAIDVASFKGIDAPSSATLAMHIGRVPELNDATDRYERMVVGLLEQLPVKRVLLEFGEPRPHDFESLRALPADKMAVLGLVRIDGESEAVDSILDRIEQAARMTDEQNLALSPRHGFFNISQVSVADQLKTQRRSLQCVSDVVQQYWGFAL